MTTMAVTLDVTSETSWAAAGAFDLVGTLFGITRELLAGS